MSQLSQAAFDFPRRRCVFLSSVNSIDRIPTEGLTEEKTGKKSKNMKTEKKGGRPKKQRKLKKGRVEEDEEDKEYMENSGCGDEDMDMENVILRSRKRNAGSSLPVQTSPSAPLDAVSPKFPALNPLGDPSTLALVKQILMGNGKSGPPEESISEPLISAPELPWQQGMTCSDTVAEEHGISTPSPEKANASSTPSSKNNTLDLMKFTSDLLDQTDKENETNTALNETLVGENVDTLEQSNNDFANVEGYNVKKELEPLLEAIFSKYGDIAKNSTFSEGSRSYLLELVCSIYTRLERLSFTQSTDLELKSLSDQIGDLDLVKVEIGWLKKRVQQICSARKLYEGVSTFEDLQARTSLLVDEKKKRKESYEKELEACRAAMNELKERVRQENEELVETVAMVEQIKLFYDKSLVHGLV